VVTKSRALPGFFEPPASDFGSAFANLANQTSTTGLTIAMAGPHEPPGLYAPEKECSSER